MVIPYAYFYFFKTRKVGKKGKDKAIPVTDRGGP
jgi:hypothetical protein